MNSVWSQFTGGFVSFFKNVWSLIKDTEAAALAVETLSAKIEDLKMGLMGLYIGFTVAITFASVQGKEFPLMFLGVSLFLGFSSFLVAEFVRFNSLFLNQLLRCLSLFFLVSIFYVVILNIFPLYFKLILFIVLFAVLFLVCWFGTIART